MCIWEGKKLIKALMRQYRRITDNVVSHLTPGAHYVIERELNAKNLVLALHSLAFDEKHFRQKDLLKLLAFSIITRKGERERENDRHIDATNRNRLKYSLDFNCVGLSSAFCFIIFISQKNLKSSTNRDTNTMDTINDNLINNLFIK